MPLERERGRAAAGPGLQPCKKSAVAALNSGFRRALGLAKRNFAGTSLDIRSCRIADTDNRFVLRWRTLLTDLLLALRERD